MRLALIALVSAALLITLAEARRIDQDFEFDDDAVQAGTVTSHARRPRRYIYDPHNPLCGALSCRRREVCVLRAAPHAAPRAALCADKKELLRRGDTVVAATPDADVLTDDDVFYDDGVRDDVIPQDATPSNPDKSRCVGCVRRAGPSQFVCGSDNRTYSSMCRLRLHNCVRGARTPPAPVGPLGPVGPRCRGYCPCKPHQRGYRYGDNRVDSLMDNFDSDELPPAKDNRWRDAESEQNEVLDRPERRQSRRRFTTVSEAMRSDSESGCALDRLADRLLDWFSVLMDDAAGTPPSHPGFPRECKPEVRWMFAHLDSNKDGLLSPRELYALRHDDREKCLRPFLSSCGGVSGVSGVSSGAGMGRVSWCGCLRRAARPCTALARAHPDLSAGTYVPSCDAAGFYLPRQCHRALGVCWCVSPHGVERPGSRAKGAPHCADDTMSAIDEEGALSVDAQEALGAAGDKARDEARDEARDVARDEARGSTSDDTRGPTPDMEETIGAPDDDEDTPAGSGDGAY